MLHISYDIVFYVCTSKMGILRLCRAVGLAGTVSYCAEGIDSGKKEEIDRNGSFDRSLAF